MLTDITPGDSGELFPQPQELVPPGTQVKFQIANLPPIPAAVLSLEDKLTLQHAKEAWLAASRLDAVIFLKLLFLEAARLRVSIDDDNQQSIQEIFSELTFMQVVLDHLASLPIEGEFARMEDAFQFPTQRFINLLLSLRHLIVRHARTLTAIGVHSETFSTGGSNLWEAIGSDLDESADFTCTPPVIRFKFDVPPELFRLRKATRELMSLLETAPAAALKLPKHAGASIAGMTIGANADTNHQPRLVIDIDHEIAILDGTPFPVGRSGALFLDALHKAGGLWRSSTELGRTISELEGTRFDRLRDKLPRPLKALIDADKGKGYRIPPERLKSTETPE